MEAKELRIGNWVLIEGDKNKVYSLKDGVVNGVLQHHVNPIPITEEWFERFGCRKDGRYRSMYIKGYELLFVSGSLRADLIDNYGEVDESIEIETVHHLQNFHFALTGEELEAI